MREFVLPPLQVYPDENHSLLGVRAHLYRSLADHFDECNAQADAEAAAAAAARGEDPVEVAMG